MRLVSNVQNPTKLPHHVKKIKKMLLMKVLHTCNTYNIMVFFSLSEIIIQPLQVLHVKNRIAPKNLANMKTPKIRMVLKLVIKIYS